MPNANTAIARLAAATLIGAAFAAAPAFAEDYGRYRLEGTENGYVRLDTKTGAISVCTDEQGQLVCKMATEDRQAYENDIAALQDRVKALEDRVAALDRKEAPAASSLPSEEEFEKSMSYMERFKRRFMDMAKSFDSEPEKPAPGAAPGRT